MSRADPLRWVKTQHMQVHVYLKVSEEKDQETLDKDVGSLKAFFGQTLEFFVQQSGEKVKHLLTFGSLKGQVEDPKRPEYKIMLFSVDATELSEMAVSAVVNLAVRELGLSCSCVCVTMVSVPVMPTDGRYVL